MTTWVTTPTETTRTYSPVALRLIDELTNQPPLGSVQVVLDIQNANGAWVSTEIPDTRTPSAVVSYPGLERHAQVTGAQPRQYRVRLIADYYIPYYRANSDGIRFTAYPYNDLNAPQQFAKIPTDTPLLPATNYPFASHIPVLRGKVVDPNNKPVPDAFVTQGNKERSLTDANGRFALPLRWVAPNVNVPIDASDRSGRNGSINVQVPAALGAEQIIPVS